jgi:MFS transporter, DHA3 family, tetracycline resistance protein
VTRRVPIRPRPSPKAIYLALTAGHAFLFTTAFVAYGVYVVSEATLGPLQLVLAGTALEGAVLLAEIPTGVVADLKSRRLSIITGLVVTGVGIMVIGAHPSFLFIAGGQAIWGVGWTFMSGAQQAWLSDEIGEDAAAPVFLSSAQVNQGVRLLAIPFGVAVALIDIQLPYIVAGGVFLLSAPALALVMQEHGFKPAPRGERTTWHSAFDTAKRGFRTVHRQPRLWIILAVGVLFGMSSEAFDRLNSLQFIDTIGLPATFDEVTWFGIFMAVSLAGGLLSTTLAHRFTSTNVPATVVAALAISTGVWAVAALVFALAGSFWLALVMFWLTAWSRAAIDPLMLVWVNRGLASDTRATILSMVGQSDALGQTAGGPMLGLLGSLTTVRVALVGVAVLLMPALPLFRAGARIESESSEERAS